MVLPSWLAGAGHLFFLVVLLYPVPVLCVCARCWLHGAALAGFPELGLVWRGGLRLPFPTVMAPCWPPGLAWRGKRGLLIGEGVKFIVLRQWDLAASWPWLQTVSYLRLGSVMTLETQADGGLWHSAFLSGTWLHLRERVEGGKKPCFYKEYTVGPVIVALIY